jgi:hypothetical protein
MRVMFICILKKKKLYLRITCFIKNEYENHIYFIHMLISLIDYFDKIKKNK